MPQPSADPSREKQLRMLRALDEAAVKLEALEKARTEPIAIIGGGCRFPGGVRDLQTYWHLLENGIDATGEMPADRWDIDTLFDPNPDTPGKISTRRGSFLPTIDRFDAEHFNIAPREAATLDPQHRLLLEVAHEALDSAGQLNDRLAENLTGVFIGVTNNDYAHLLREHQSERPLDAYFVTGNAPNSAAGRISYQLGLRGPSLVLDTACSSSLATIHTACQSLRARECHLALAGGVNLLILPDSFAALSRAHMLAPDGRCKSFDAAADGYGRGEGGGLVVLKRLSDARRDGDTILATIRGGAINHDGPASGFTVPNGAAQRTLLQQALTASRLTPTDIDYIEAHGTGTSLGDPIEVNALVDVLGVGRSAANPLLLGSVKTNIGHLESAAGIAGLLKVVLSLWYRQLPRHLHFQTPSPRIPWAEIPVKITQHHEAWPDRGHPRRAGVSSFGVSGTNVHLILEESPLEMAARHAPPSPRKFFGDGPRHWAVNRPATTTIDAWLHRVDWPLLPRKERATTPIVFSAPGAATAVDAWSRHAADTYAGAAYRDVLSVLEPLASAYAAAAVAALPGRTEVQPSHVRLWHRIQYLATLAPAMPASAEQVSALLAAQPDAAIEIELLQRCGEALPAVLRGEVDPLALLFPSNVTPTAADLYSRNPVSRALNDLIATWLNAAIPTDRPLRVLEIGGGTGATTKTVLTALQGREIDYVFTDISPLFIAQAKSQFADNSAVTCRPLDIERDPRDQGFAPGEFDLIVAANVVHATEDLAITLAHCRQLLAGGGQLALMELTSPLGFLDLIFGLTDGWWRFTDTKLRPNHPLLAPAQWQALLCEQGFNEAQIHLLPESAGEIFRQQALITAPAKGPTTFLPESTGRWLLIGPAPHALTEILRSRGAEVTTTPTSDLSPLRQTEPWSGVVSFAPSTATPIDPTPLRETLAIAHALIAAPAPWWIVTRGAVDAGDDTPPDGINLSSSGLWGFARTVAQEHPELQVRRIDLDIDATLDDASALALELLQPSAEDQLALRGHDRFSARLIGHASTQSPDPLPTTTDGSILIVGGLGGLGLSLARWFGDQGARDLTLASRRAPNASALAEIAGLRARGLTIHIHQIDVTSPQDVTRVLEQITADSPPLRGIVHAAGVLDDGSLRQLDWSRFPPVLDPKITGAWHLHEQTLHLPLDFFLLFSSSTALLGTPGQANHAAANAWLDALAHHRRRAGLPAVSINWGPWSDIGAAARQHVAEHARRHGLGTISPAKGWHTLGAIMREHFAQVAVLPITWSEVPASLTRSPFFDGVRAETATPAAATDTESPASAPTDWTALPLHTRVTRLRERVETELTAVLGLEAETRIDPAKGFFTLGMDSLTAVELRNRLQTQLERSIPSTVIFDHPTTDGLSRHLAGLFQPAPTVSPDATSTPLANPVVDELSDVELSDLLDEELKDL
ncbi:type I polyketide synthase [Synoicihabitans lomoniglobus]|uniref:SDR family NAD(P)-dependent oxidoreductase n=1 Tax=Synoicihabitans lomoniglobus TaxID=2909285 RepID=A0AAE9ZYR5_9BACT|nr:SDR family NAD(P)-dependent oxidoreductase [Opitutaceae bacterium LMO-M01]WED65714.1 SDR family NAD(P)-dependent oxidoreductase [Opitutaceae bacterium LMO-M01]